MDASSADRNKEDELLVFGYACKLFRDDERALYIDSGKHLIPWMADESLKIDRYDGRGALSDLRPHEPPPGGFDRWHGLTERERKLEEVVDQERYMALYKDEDEERMLEEEEWKRLQSLAGDAARYSQMGFSYESAGAAAAAAERAAPAAADGSAAAEDEPYEPPAALGVPDDMAQPKTRRHADIIERTAHFVARQGPQMEILIKAKQSENPMFNFLSFDDPLQSFFRHMVVMIKAGRFTIGQQKQVEDDEAYLHPALNLSRPDIAPGKADTMYQPSANCAYQLLVKNIRSRQAADSPAGSGTSSPTPSGGAAPSAAAVAATAVAAAPTPSPTASASPAATPAPAPAQATAAAAAAAAAAAPAAAEAAPAPAALPPPDVKVIIDKMASYVAKNGRDFEGIVMGRGDERFSFLKETHKHHAYYRQKLVQYERDLGKSKPAAAPAAAPTAAAAAADKSNKPGPVSFSIRPKSDKESAPLERSALPLEESEDEEGDQAQTSAAETNGDVRQEKAVPAPATAPAVTSRGDSAKKQSRQQPLVAPAPGVGRDEIKLERKRRAAQFLAKLRQDVDKIKQPMIGPQLPPGPLPVPSGSDSDSDSASAGGRRSESREPPSPAAAPVPAPAPAPTAATADPQHDEEEEESGDDADLDKYKLVDSDSPHSVPEPSPGGGSGAAETRPGSCSSRASQPSDRRPASAGGRRGSRDASERRASRGTSASDRRASRGASASDRRASRDASLRHGSRAGSVRHDGRRSREERRHRHRHKKRSHHRRRRHRRRGSELEDELSEPARSGSRSRSRSRSRSPRRHRKRKKRARSPPASYKRLRSPVAAPTAAAETAWRRSRPVRSRSPLHTKRKRSHSSRHKHKSKKSKRSKRSPSRSVSPAVVRVTEVTLSPGQQVDPAAAAGDIIDLTSPDRRPSPTPSGASSPREDSPPREDRAPEDSPPPREDSRPPSAGSGSGGAWSGSDSAASSRSGSPAADRPADEQDGRGSSPDERRPDEDELRTDEAIAQLKRKLVRRSAAAANGAGRPAGAVGGPLPVRSSSALVAQMAEGLKAKVHEMMKGSLLGK